MIKTNNNVLFDTNLHNAYLPSIKLSALLAGLDT